MCVCVCVCVVVGGEERGERGVWVCFVGRWWLSPQTQHLKKTPTQKTTTHEHHQNPHKDYCGSLSEDAIRRNFALIYELLDEAVDYGTPQNTSTEALRDFVLNDPVVVAPPSAKPLSAFGSGSGGSATGGLTKGPTGVFKSVLDTARTGGARRDEIFVDVVERLTATFSASGHAVSAQIDGAIQVKSYLSGNPPIKIKLNDGLLISRRDGGGYGGGGGGGGGFSSGDYASDAGLVVLEDVAFHEGLLFCYCLCLFCFV